MEHKQLITLTKKEISKLSQSIKNHKQKVNKLLVESATCTDTNRKRSVHQAVFSHQKAIKILSQKKELAQSWLKCYKENN